MYVTAQGKEWGSGSLTRLGSCTLDPLQAAGMLFPFPSDKFIVQAANVASEHWDSPGERHPTDCDDVGRLVVVTVFRPLTAYRKPGKQRFPPTPHDTSGSDNWPLLNYDGSPQRLPPPPC